MYNKEDDLHLKAKHASDDLNQTINKAKNISDEASDYLHEMKDKATHALKKTYRQVKSQSEDLEDSFIATVKKHPLESIGVGILVGFFVSLFARK